MPIEKGLLLEQYDEEELVIDRGEVIEVVVKWEEGSETPSVQTTIDWQNKGCRRYPFNKVAFELNKRSWREA